MDECKYMKCWFIHYEKSKLVANHHFFYRGRHIRRDPFLFPKGIITSTALFEDIRQR